MRGRSALRALLLAQDAQQSMSPSPATMSPKVMEAAR